MGGEDTKRTYALRRILPFLSSPQLPLAWPSMALVRAGSALSLQPHGGCHRRPATRRVLSIPKNHIRAILRSAYAWRSGHTCS